MAITNGYCTLTELKQSSIMNIASDSSDDALLEIVIEAASRTIDAECNRHFFYSAETRYFSAEDPNRVFLDDVNSTASFALYTDDDGDGTYENTWASTDYHLLPANASLYNGWPATYLERSINGSYSFPVSVRKGVKVTATFGWAAVPTPIRLACMMLAHREYKRLQSPLGVAGMNAMGNQTLTIPKIDPDIYKLLDPFKRLI